MITRRSAESGESILVWIAAGVSILLYFWRLATVPLFIGGDEAYFGLEAHLIASTGRDLAGQFFPMFFRIDAHTWYEPVLVYLIAPVSKVFGVSAWSLRAPTAGLGVLNVVMTYAVGRKLFGGVRYALLAALLIALSPPHLMLSRMAVDYVCPLPFVLGWLWCLLTVLDTADPKFAFGAGLLLGLGCYSYIAAWVMMPIFLVITFVTLHRTSGRGLLLIGAAAGFALALAPAVIWMRVHPDVLAATLTRYRLSGPDSGSLLDAIRSLTHYYTLQAKLSLYWNYFDPVYLFLTGSPDPTLSTRKAGVFLVAGAVLLGAGAYEILRRRDRSLVLLAGFAMAPVAPVMIDTGNAVQRELVIVVFGALIAAYGARRLVEHADRRIRVFGIVALATLPVQFAYFAADYFVAYPARAADRLDPLNMREVTRYVIDTDSQHNVPRVYLGEALDDVLPRFRFYLAESRREDLWERTWIMDAAAHNQWSVLAPLPTMPLDPSGIPAGSMLLFYATDPAIAEILRDRQCCRVEQTIRGPSREALSVLVRRLPPAP